MRFILRSAFWLSAAYLVMAPNADMGAAAQSAGEQLARSGHELASSIQPPSCQSIECAAGRLVTTGALELLASRSGIHPMQETPPNQAVPLPRPRPDWAG